MTQLASSPVSMRPARLSGQYRLSVPMDRRVPRSELPYYENIPYDSDWHRDATYLLTDIMDYYRKDRHDLYAAARMFVYFDPDQVKTHNFRGPDFFVVKGAKKHEFGGHEFGGHENSGDTILNYLAPYAHSGM